MCYLMLVPNWMGQPVERLFEHGAAECLTRNPVFACLQGKLEFISESDTGPSSHPRGQALVEIEFLTRMLASGRGERWTCVYPAYPLHLPLMSRLFPSATFFAYGAGDGGGDEYDPDLPASRSQPYRPKDCGGNVTAVCQAFDSETARLLGGRCMSQHDKMFMICSDRHTATRQMMFHSLVRPAYSLLSLTGLIAEEFLSGDLYYPLYTGASSSLVHLVAPGRACARLYYPMWLRDELAHHHILIRGGSDHDRRAETQILTQYLFTAWGRAEPTQVEGLRAELPGV